MLDSDPFSVRGFARQRGVTLIETTIALGILLVLISGVAQLFAFTASTSSDIRHRTMSLWLARAKLAQLESLRFIIEELPGGTTLVFTDTVTDLGRDPPGINGAGLQPSPADALVVPHAGYVDYLDEWGRWVGAGPAPPPGAIYTRRWTVSRTGAHPREVALFQVIATRVSTASAVTGEALLKHPDVVRGVGGGARRVQ